MFGGGEEEGEEDSSHRSDHLDSIVRLGLGGIHVHL
jgi:hypothetical protein